MPILPESNREKARQTPLSERLSAIAESLPLGGVVCDIGSDHGSLPLYLLQHDLCRRVLISDIHPLPLDRAKSALEEAGLGHRANFFLTDGLQGLIPHAPDAYVIAGMGGETIAGILSRELSNLPVGSFFALQPMSRVRHLRRFLYENGFRVEKERVVLENKKTFLIFFARYDGKPRPREEDFYFLGEFLPTLREEAVKKYFSHLLSQLKSKIDGKRKAGKPTDSEEREEAALFALLEDFL